MPLYFCKCKKIIFTQKQVKISVADQVDKIVQGCKLAFEGCFPDVSEGFGTEGTDEGSLV